jgi:hypothetical protein
MIGAPTHSNMGGGIIFWLSIAFRDRCGSSKASDTIFLVEIGGKQLFTNLK